MQIFRICIVVAKAKKKEMTESIHKKKIAIRRTDRMHMHIKSFTSCYYFSIRPFNSRENLQYKYIQFHLIISRVLEILVRGQQFAIR